MDLSGADLNKPKIPGRTGETPGSGAHFKIQLLLTIIGVTGIVAIVLPFTWSTSPFNAAFNEYVWRLAWPGFLPVLITSASLRWLFSTTPSLTEQVIAYLVSLACVFVTLSFYFLSGSGWPGDFKEWLTYFIPLITLGFGIFTMLVHRKDVEIKPFLFIMSMQTAYLANILLCLTGFLGEWQIGAYFSLITTIAYLLQIVLVFKKQKGTSLL